MLITPLGEIEIRIDNNPISYTAELVPNDRLCPVLLGRYKIVVDFIPDSKKHSISCCIKTHIPSQEDFIETGERLELKSFYKDKIKLSIGMEGDTGYIGNQRCSEYDYDNDYLNNGATYEILDFTKTRRFIFGIAWIECIDEDTDLQTWNGADPTLFRNK